MKIVTVDIEKWFTTNIINITTYDIEVNINSLGFINKQTFIGIDLSI